MLSVTFWIIVSFSDGAYNRGSMDELSIQFTSEASCQYTLEQLKEISKPEWGNSIMDCVEVKL